MFYHPIRLNGAEAHKRLVIYPHTSIANVGLNSQEDLKEFSKWKSESTYKSIEEKEIELQGNQTHSYNVLLVWGESHRRRVEMIFVHGINSPLEKAKLRHMSIIERLGEVERCSEMENLAIKIASAEEYNRRQNFSSLRQFLSARTLPPKKVSQGIEFQCFPRD